MPQFIELYTIEDILIYININSIILIESDKTHTKIYFTDGTDVCV